jgi:hypothetical protein
MEAGTHSIWISEQLQELGHEVIVANVRELRAISHSDAGWATEADFFPNDAHHTEGYREATFDQSLVKQYNLVLFAREPRNLESDSGIALQSGFVHGGFPTFILNQTAKLEVFVEAFYSRNLEAVLRCAAGDKVFRGFCVAIGKLHVFSRGKMIGEPGLTAFGLPPNRISDDEALIGVTLFLHLFGVDKLSAVAAAGWRIGADCLHAKIKRCDTWKMGQINAWANGGAPWRTDGAHIVVSERVRV